VHDVVIRGGTVVDGTGAPPRTADVAVDAGRIVEVGRIGEGGRRELDADGLVVTPGFVDVHTHYDGQATWDPHLTPSCWHGVTTAVLGNCGVGFAPVHADRHEWLIELMEGVEDIPGSALAEGIRWSWESFPEYLDALDAMPRTLDVAAQLPHGALRAYVMGERGADNATATADDLDQMSRLARDALAAGAVGISTSRTAGHMAVDGRPVPGTYAAQDELWALGGALAEHGRGLLQLVASGTTGEISGDPPEAAELELDWMLRFARETRRPVTFLVMESTRRPDQWRGWLDRVAAARDDGVPIYPQVASRCFGVLMGHQSRLNPFRTRPAYAEIADLPLADRVAQLRSPERKARILADAPVPEDRPSFDAVRERSFDFLFPLGDALDYEPSPDESVGALARAAGQDVWETAYDVLLRDEGRELLLLPLLNYGRGSYDGLHELMTNPYTVQGLGDGGAHCNVICDASMTTYLLTHWVRDRTRGPRLALEHAVRRLTHDGAALYGFADRGVLAPGMKADVNLIDLEHLNLDRPELVHDLPGGAGRLVQGSRGYVATIVSGEVVMQDGGPTGARPGRLVRA
jgi:N-acyl-D-aspartate/D-glutamate deacylase